MPLFEFSEISFADSVLRVLCKVTVKRYYLVGLGLKKKIKEAVVGDDLCVWRTNYIVFSLPARRYIYCYRG